MSAVHRSREWLRFIAKARPIFAATLPAPCARCGRTVEPGTKWVVGHIIDDALGGHIGLDNAQLEHRICSDKSGGRLGARISNSKRRQRSEFPTW